MKSKTNIYKLLDLNNTILYFFKNQVELLYDYSLTLEIYFKMLLKQRLFKYIFENQKKMLKKKIKLTDLKAYYLEYFYDFTREHKYKLEINIDEENTTYNFNRRNLFKNDNF